MLRIFKERAQRVSSALDEQQTREYHSKLQLMMSSERMLENSMAVLERQQQRLLLLRHAMWCTAPDETCVAAPNCGETKRLWEHMSACQKPTCSYSHCVSSRYVLSHFQQCENSKCVVCQLLQYAVEVKEKDGSLVMNADRALRQIQLATEWQYRFAATVPELTRDETHQLEQIQVRLRGINLKTLYLNSKQLEGHAEQLGNQAKAMMAEVRQLTQLCNSTHHPDLKKQYRDLLQRKNAMLRRITERLQKSTSQRRVLHHVICSRIKATTF
ncbi:hypothetical protein Poli38472_004110 [Pythium oligandrum]|uniref:histone acetyltransferase n=1 Tax=Pythium oligandrum TaxID=41045 RepID=A0A8K1FJR6_PYTOL|nr:hypothetical protein Poli38472_004110 [Pythium oligandrum]|eukprot:TMW66345.1 hypothetical protein Poli38472_004110 [Pythium oligandrum]